MPPLAGRAYSAAIAADHAVFAVGVFCTARDALLRLVALTRLALAARPPAAAAARAARDRDAAADGGGGPPRERGAARAAGAVGGDGGEAQAGDRHWRPGRALWRRLLLRPRAGDEVPPLPPPEPLVRVVLRALGVLIGVAGAFFRFSAGFLRHASNRFLIA